MVQSIKAAFLKEAGTAGTTAPTTCGANISCVGRIEQVLPLGTKPIRVHVGLRHMRLGFAQLA